MKRAPRARLGGRLRHRPGLGGLGENATGLPARRSGPGRAALLRAALLRAALLPAALLPAGCQATQVNANPEGPTWVHQPSGTMQVMYTRSILAESRSMGEPYESGGLALDIAGRRVFAGSRDQGVYALQAQDGAVLWRFETLGAVESRPLFDAEEGVLYVGSNDGAIYKLRGADGKLLWRFSTNAEVTQLPVLQDGLLVVTNANDTVVAVEAKTGKLAWSQHRPPALGMEISGNAGVLVWRGLVHTAFSDGTVTAYDLRTGAESWAPVDLSAAAEHSLGEIPTYLDVDATPVAHLLEGTPVVITASYEGGVFALAADNGTRIWENTLVSGASELYLWSQPEHPARGGGPPVAARKLLIVSTGTTGLWALDPNTGEEVWRREIPLGGASRAVPALGALMFSTTQAGLFLISPLDGRVIDGVHTGAGFSMAPAVYGQRAFILSNAGRLYALHLGRPL